MSKLELLPWIEKYRPQKMNEVVQEKHIIDLFNNIIISKQMPHLLLYGLPGTGKTSSILALGREMFGNFFSQRVIEFNASDDRGINAVREKITKSARQYVSELETSEGKKIPSFKIIILDEADSMTDEAQDALRVVIEQYSTVTRFCFICNFINKITDAIKSRCSSVNFKKISSTYVMNQLKKIASLESMTLSDDNFNTIINVTDGDLRRAIMILQNLKYKHDYYVKINQKISDLTPMDIKVLQRMDIMSIKNTMVTSDDIYHIAGYIHIDEAKEIIKKIIEAKSIKDVNVIANDTMTYGFSIDNVILQLNKAILSMDGIDVYKKSMIILESGKTTYLIKDGASESIQLLNFLVQVYKVINEKKIS